MEFSSIRKQFISVVTAITLVTSPSFITPVSDHIVYRVQSGDSLSRILYDKFKMTPVYGKHGYINQVVWANKGRVLSRGDQIQPGDTLLLPAATDEAIAYADTEFGENTRTRLALNDSARLPASSGTRSWSGSAPGNFRARIQVSTSVDEPAATASKSTPAHESPIETAQGDNLDVPPLPVAIETPASLQTPAQVITEPKPIGRNQTANSEQTKLVDNPPVPVALPAPLPSAAPAAPAEPRSEPATFIALQAGSSSASMVQLDKKTDREVASLPIPPVPTLTPLVMPTLTPALTPVLSPSPTIAPALSPALTPAPSLTPEVAPILAPTPTLILPPKFGNGTNAQSSSTVPTPVSTRTPEPPPALTPAVVPPLSPTAMPTLTPTAAPSPPPSLTPTLTPAVSTSENETMPTERSPNQVPLDSPKQMAAATFNESPSPSPVVTPAPTPTPTLTPIVIPAATPALTPIVIAIGTDAEKTTQVPAPSPTPMAKTDVAPATASTLVPTPPPYLSPTPPPNYLMGQMSDHEPQSYVSFTSGAMFAGLYGIDNVKGYTGSLSTTMSPILEVNWLQTLSPQDLSRFYLTAESATYRSERKGVTISNGTMINTEFGINYQHRFYDRFGIGLDTAIEQRPIFVAITAKGISLEQIPIVKFRAQFDLSVARGRTYDFSITGGISSLDASTYDGYTITPGRAYDAALEVSRQFKKTNLDCKLKYERRDQNSQAFSMSSRDVGVLCGLGWEQ